MSRKPLRRDLPLDIRGGLEEVTTPHAGVAVSRGVCKFGRFRHAAAEFTHSLGRYLALYELTMSVLLYAVGTQTIGVYLYEMQSYADPQAAAVLSAILLALVLSGNALLRWITRGAVGV